MTHYLLLEISKPGHIRETWRTDTIQQMVRVADAIEAGDEQAAMAMTDVAPHDDTVIKLDGEYTEQELRDSPYRSMFTQQHDEPLGEMFRGPAPL